MKPTRAARRLDGLPALLLLGVGLISLLAFNVNRARYYAPLDHHAVRHLAIADNLFAHGLAMFRHVSFGDDGESKPAVYSRFPVGGFALIRLTTTPFGDALAARVFAARLLMLAFLVAAMMLAYQALRRIAANGWIALAATSIGFSSYYVLANSTVVSTEMIMDLLGVMLTLHGMVVFTQDRKRFRQLWIKSCAALLIGWHVYALLAPFVLLGLGGELVAALRSRRLRRPPRQERGNLPAIGALLRLAVFSRYSRLGLVALLFGVAMLAVNWTSEYVVLEGRTPFTQLPSLQSMLKRTSWSRTLDVQPTYAWSEFLPRQFYRVVGATAPGLVGWPGRTLEVPPSFPPSPLIGAGVLISGVVFLWLPFVRRHRLILGSLALSGFCWAFGMRGNAYFAGHDFEAIYFVGVPLTLVTLALVALRRFAGASAARLLLPGVAIAALFVFVLSAGSVTAQQMPAPATTDHIEAVYADMANIRRFTHGKRVLAPARIGSDALFGDDDALDWLLTGSFVRRGLWGHLPDYDLLLLPHHRQAAGLLTPDNKVVFLYDAGVEPASIQRSFVDAIVSASSALAATGAFRLYANDAALSYVKTEGCTGQDVSPRFFLHVHPVFVEDLPERRRGWPSAHFDFGFQRHGIAIGDSCAARVALPRYPIASIRTGQFTHAGKLWEDTFAFAPTYRARYAEVAPLEPNARAEFRLYLRLTEQERTLTYVKTPCAAAEVASPFYLHATPARREDLPEDRQASGFDNLDFDFPRRGALFDGKCVAIVPLPKYALARIKTGQWAAGKRLWEATLQAGA